MPFINLYFLLLHFLSAQPELSCNLWISSFSRRHLNLQKRMNFKHCSPVAFKQGKAIKILKVSCLLTPEVWSLPSIQSSCYAWWMTPFTTRVPFGNWLWFYMSRTMQTSTLRECAVTLCLSVETKLFSVFIIPSYFHLDTNTHMYYNRHRVCRGGMFESSSDSRCGSQKYASAAPLQVHSDWGETWNDKKSFSLFHHLSTSAALFLCMKPWTVMYFYTLCLCTLVCDYPRVWK